MNVQILAHMIQKPVLWVGVCARAHRASGTLMELGRQERQARAPGGGVGVVIGQVGLSFKGHTGHIQPLYGG